MAPRKSKQQRQSEAEPEPPSPAAPRIAHFNFQKFDPKLHDAFTDFRTVIELPFDSDISGVKVLRIVVHEKGKAMQVPTDKGRYVVCGKWWVQPSLTLVHFAESTARTEPELLLNFIDYGFANRAMTGLAVESLTLPLMLSKTTYNTAARITKLSDVAGFSEFNPGLTPWSTQLKPTLAKIQPFKDLEILAPGDINKYVSSQRMNKRIDMLADRAHAALAEQVKALARSDPSQAAKQKGIFESKLNGLLAAIEKLPPTQFDHSILTRVQTVGVAADKTLKDAPQWMSTPQARNMASGKLPAATERLLRSARSDSKRRQLFEHVDDEAQVRAEAAAAKEAVNARAAAEQEAADKAAHAAAQEKAAEMEQQEQEQEEDDQYLALPETGGLLGDGDEEMHIDSDLEADAAKVRENRESEEDESEDEGKGGPNLAANRPKRESKAPKRPMPASPKKLTEKPPPKQPKKSAADTTPINPRTGKPFVRGPYNKTGDGKFEKQPKAEKQLAKAKGRGDAGETEKDEKALLKEKDRSTAAQAEVNALKLRVSELQGQIALLERTCAEQKEAVILQKALSDEKVERAKKEGELLAVEKGKHEYREGIKLGAMLASGGGTNISTLISPPPGAGPSNLRGLLDE